MQFGMPALLELKTAEENARLCRELKLDFVELNMCLPEYQAERLDSERFAEIAEQNGIYFTIHLDDTNTPCDFNAKIASSYIETVLQTIKFAKHISAPVLVMHLSRGTYFTLPHKKVFLFEEYKLEYLQKLTHFRDKCTAAIGDSDIKICVENCGDFARFPFIALSLDILLESPVFALCFDIGHNAAAEYSDEPTVMKNEKRLYHMHLHDAKNGRNHLPLGEGEVDIMKYLSLANHYNCRVVLEVKTADSLRDAVHWLKNRNIK